ncbi:torsin-1A-like [Pelobates fuscus]|uniref:torsin-1A-like n=1 Tax=Pelobates fuscus TaxID=191477 RepID=UPI002FE48AC0
MAAADRQSMAAGHCMLLLALLCSPVTALDPYSVGAAILGTGSVLIKALPGSQYFMSRSCGEETPFSGYDLEKELNEKLFGQHLAHKLVLQSLRGFMKNKNPRKPLVMSFHGWTGTGKNHITSIVVKNIFKLGMASESVHFFVVTLHFPHEDHVRLHKDQLKSWIQGNVSRCERSIFIFDEADKLHPELIRMMKSFLDNYNNIDGVSYRRAIFIFISNLGGDLINQKMLKFWKAKKKREELVYSDFEDMLSSELFNNNESGFRQSEIIAKDIIDIYVPFLPLEFIHVKNCVLAELKRMGLPEDETLAMEIAEDVGYFPKEERIFSTKGCRSVGKKLDQLL